MSHPLPHIIVVYTLQHFEDGVLESSFHQWCIVFSQVGKSEYFAHRLYQFLEHIVLDVGFTVELEVGAQILQQNLGQLETSMSAFNWTVNYIETFNTSLLLFRSVFSENLIEMA